MVMCMYAAGTPQHCAKDATHFVAWESDRNAAATFWVEITITLCEACIPKQCKLQPGTPSIYKLVPVDQVDDQVDQVRPAHPDIQRPEDPDAG